MQINIAHYKMNISEHSYSKVLCTEQCGGKRENKEEEKKKEEEEENEMEKEEEK